MSPETLPLAQFATDTLGVVRSPAHIVIMLPRSLALLALLVNVCGVWSVLRAFADVASTLVKKTGVATW